ncbi:hypothetical protein OKW45_004272 [Paraburkholderia sp. WSM4175]|uniref:hypothetical protein n=1 Tax=Paraburkholderia sp. WSM4175 TaxID=2991072 RepID=UPI003D23BC64
MVNNTNEMISFALKKIVLPSMLTAPAIGASSAAFVAQAEDRNDFPTESNKCTDAWEKAFHKANGADAPIAYDQVWEFVDNCRAGKYPSKAKKKK